MNYKQSYVLYESVYAQFERLLKADKLEGAIIIIILFCLLIHILFLIHILLL